MLVEQRSLKVSNSSTSWLARCKAFKPNSGLPELSVTSRLNSFLCRLMVEEDFKSETRTLEVWIFMYYRYENYTLHSHDIRKSDPVYTVAYTSIRENPRPKMHACKQYYFELYLARWRISYRSRFVGPSARIAAGHFRRSDRLRTRKLSNPWWWISYLRNSSPERSASSSPNRSRSLNNAKGK